MKVSIFQDLKLLLARAETSKKYAWLSEYDSMSLQEVVRHANGVASDFMSGKKGFPRFKSRYGEQSSCPCASVSAGPNWIRVPKIGRIKAVVHRSVEGKVKRITLRRDRCGDYWASILIEDGKPETEPAKEVRGSDVRGIDLGLKDLVLTSNGDKIPNPKHRFEQDSSAMHQKNALAGRAGASTLCARRAALALSAALSLGLSLGLSGCASTGAAGPVVAPTPVETPNVVAVKRAVFADDPTVTVATALEEYAGCLPPSRLWEEVERGDVQFSCRMDDGTILQLDFRVKGEVSAGSPVAQNDPGVALRSVTFTSQNDAEFAGVSVRGPDAADMLRSIYKNEPLF